MLNSFVGMGRLTSSPELRHTPNGVCVCSFTIAIERDFAPKGEKRSADFIDCVAWRNTAEFLCQYFAKGSMVAITGQMQTRTYEDKNANRRKACEIIVDKVSFTGEKSEQKTQSGYTQPPALDNEAPQQQSFTPVGQTVRERLDDFEIIDDSEDLPF